MEQLAELAAAAKRDGEGFDAFWHRALRPGERVPLVTEANAPAGAVRWPTDNAARHAWRAVLLDEAVREAWRRAFEDLPPTRAEQVFGVLLSALADAPAGEPLIEAA